MLDCWVLGKIGAFPDEGCICPKVVKTIATARKQELIFKKLPISKYTNFPNCLRFQIGFVIWRK